MCRGLQKGDNISVIAVGGGQMGVVEVDEEWQILHFMPVRDPTSLLMSVTLSLI